MKIRIKGNSIRYRLTKSDVAVFCETGYFEEQTSFSENVFVYALKASKTIQNMEAKFELNKIEVTISEDLIGEWATNNKVGYHHNLQLHDGTVLSILIEKDFTCLDDTIEDQSDNYPNPRFQ
ncbi:hypothetical protein JQC67_16405 [Aurantibacter crassamenti]|uniref:DUF7009 family protein n=1 Tax=Aurantibacter crassamenti TaxID=1837375 RepID=UPI00193AA433|nr:hypothetical protein [Aurantibacter crassamenti]MBM1107739.1 hypothetical protein [Aurantibacter crassamenti]